MSTTKARTPRRTKTPPGEPRMVVLAVVGDSEGSGRPVWATATPGLVAHGAVDPRRGKWAVSHLDSGRIITGARTWEEAFAIAEELGGVTPGLWLRSMEGIQGDAESSRAAGRIVQAWRTRIFEEECKAGRA